MAYHFLVPLREFFFVFNVFRYITVRSVAAAVTAFVLSVFLGPLVFRFLRGRSITAPTKRKYAEALDPHRAAKVDVPTMGGVLIVGTVLFSMVFWGNFSNRFTWLSLTVFLLFGIVGWVDDALKASRRSSEGLAARAKLVGQLAIGFFIGWVLFLDPKFPKEVQIPFLKEAAIPLGILFVPFVICVLVGTSNALNLTDGLDGLAVGCTIFAAGALGILAYVTGHAQFARYLQVSFIEESGELAVFCAALAGAGAGFLWYNAYPADVFMGDTGALSLGGALGAISLFIKQELVLLIVGGVFVWEALSVILQVLSFRLLGKRVFKMAPYHHHLQLSGWPESKVTVRFWIVAFILALVGLSTLKLR